MNLPKQYAWLNNEGAPKMLVESLRHYGLMEIVGKTNNADIMRWAKEVGVSGWYPADETPWCGLFVGVCAFRSGYKISNQLLAAISWATWGDHVEFTDASLWDILVFRRKGGNHVGFYVGETNDAYLVYGGNQSNMVGFTWKLKTDLIAVRRAPFKIAQPTNIRKVYLLKTGVISINEA